MEKKSRYIKIEYRKIIFLIPAMLLAIGALLYNFGVSTDSPSAILFSLVLILSGLIVSLAVGFIIFTIKILEGSLSRVEEEIASTKDDKKEEK